MQESNIPKSGQVGEDQEPAEMNYIEFKESINRPVPDEFSSNEYGLDATKILTMLRDQAHGNTFAIQVWQCLMKYGHEQPTLHYMLHNFNDLGIIEYVKNLPDIKIPEKLNQLKEYLDIKGYSY